MKIVLVSIGTLGDVYPYAALGRGLKDAGHEAVIATHAPFEPFIRQKGLLFSPLAGDPVQWLENGELLSLIQKSTNFVSWLAKLRELSDAIIPDILGSCRESCRGAEAIIYSPLAWAGYSIAEEMRVKSIAACLQPLTPTGKFPSAWFPANSLKVPLFNRLSHKLARQIYWQFFRPYINPWRKHSLLLPPLPLMGPYAGETWKRQPFLYGFSPHVIPKPPDWPENAHVTGWWLFESDPGYVPPSPLEDFISSGNAPIYAGFGSMPQRNPEQLLDTILLATEASGVRVVIQLKAEGLPEGRITDNLFNAGWVDHTWLFPRMKAVVHHGGASSFASSLYAGVPVITVPHAWDQYFWGRRIAQLGLGPSPIKRADLNKDRLTRAIRMAVTGPGYLKRCSELSGKLRAENGVASAVGVIEKYLKVD